MKAQLTPECLRVDMTVEECTQTATGQPSGDRINPLSSDAKIEVFCLEDSSDPDLVQRTEAGRSVAQFTSNDDLLLYVPRIALRSVVYPGITFTGEDITSRVDKEHLEAWRDRIPGQTICLVFEGSLNRIDIPSHFIGAAEEAIDHQPMATEADRQGRSSGSFLTGHDDFGFGGLFDNDRLF